MIDLYLWKVKNSINTLNKEMSGEKFYKNIYKYKHM